MECFGQRLGDWSWPARCGGDFETCFASRSCEALEGVIGRQPGYVQVPGMSPGKESYPQYHRLVRGCYFSTGASLPALLIFSARNT